MIISYIAISLVIVLAIAVVILNKKGIDRHNANASSLSGLNEKCETIVATINTKDKATRGEFESLRSAALKQVKKIETLDKEISKRIDAQKKESEIAIGKVKKQAADDIESSYNRSIQHTDDKVDDAVKYVDDLHYGLVAQLEKRMETLASILDELNNENAQLRIELDEQKKKLNFYANIEEAAESLTVREDTEERARALEAIRRKIVSREKSSGEKISQIAEEKETLADGEGPQISEKTPIFVSEPIDITTEYNDEIIEENDQSEGMSLDNEQEFARNYMDDTTENVFITGKAGTGKSFLLDIFRLTTNKSSIVLAPTGIAALNVNGATLHSTFGYNNLVYLDVEDISEKTIKLKSEKKSVLKNVRTIIIDEISMVRADTFDKIDRILKVINHSDLPFGGKQMLLFGDLFQLPPVVKRQENEYLLDKYGGIHFFHSDAYKEGNFKFIELTENHRQRGDEIFFGILNRIREGEATSDDIELLNTRYTPDESVYDRYTALFPTKAEAEKVNKNHMDQIESGEIIYEAKIILNKKRKQSIENVFPILEELHLKLGASIMMVANDPGGRWVNGTVGIVKELSKDNITVSFGKGRNYDIQPLEFDEQEISYENGKITYEKVFSVMQYPVIPAYAITIHKSQGQTYENVMCDIERCFASGQAYVALSRCASLKGLHLKTFVTPASIKVDREVLQFYRSQSSNNLLS